MTNCANDLYVTSLKTQNFTTNVWALLISAFVPKHFAVFES